MAFTISTHNGTKISRQHNIRNRKVTDKEAHIDPNGKFEVWVDEPIQNAYDRLFSDAVREYNAQVTAKGHKERCIQSYYHKIKEDKQKNLAYEMIISVGSYDNRIDAKLGKEIMREFVDDWKTRNPSLELIGAYYHNDEQGVPHVHIDYIGVARNLKRGMNVQNALVKALEFMGFKTKSVHDTAQIQWEKRENAYLEKLCNERGIEVKHPHVDGRKHLETEIFKKTKQNEMLEKENESLRNKVNSLVDRHNSLIDIIKCLKDDSIDLAYNVIEDYELTSFRFERAR